MLLEFKKFFIVENLLGYSSGFLFFDIFCFVYIDVCVIYLVWLVCIVSILFFVYNFIVCIVVFFLKL